MYNKILVPLDGSKTAECALEHVETIATGCNVPEVILLFVVESIPAGLYQSTAEGKEKMMAWGKESLAKIEKSLMTDGVAAKSIVLEGKPAETIIDYAAKNDVDLIIMSTHGRSGPSRWAFGSVAEKVIRTSTVPILIAAPKGCRMVC